jgi:hypothetical protein
MTFNIVDTVDTIDTLILKVSVENNKTVIIWELWEIPVSGVPTCHQKVNWLTTSTLSPNNPTTPHLLLSLAKKTM